MADVESVHIEPTNGKKPEDDSVIVKEENGSEDDNLKNLSKLEKDIIRQIEYYFSESNMRRDKFLIQKVSENDEGWVDISVLLTFNRLKSITEDAAAISDAMNKSPNGTVEINEDRTKLRRHPDNPLPEFNETRRKELLARTAYAKGFPLDSELSTLLEYFNNNFEKVEHLLMRKYFCTKTKKHLFKGSVFVTFATRELAENFVNKPELKYMEKELLRYTQSKYIEIKKKEKDDADKKKKAKKEAKELATDKEEFALPKSAVVHFAGADGDLSREDIKERVVEVDSGLEIAFIHFNKGDKEGEIRFSKANNGKLLMEKLEDAKLKVKDFELTFSVLEGEAEEKFLEQAILDMKQRRSKFQKGGKNNFNNRKRKNDSGSFGAGKRTRSGRD